jgi:hypothetical protein
MRDLALIGLPQTFEVVVVREAEDGCPSCGIEMRELPLPGSSVMLVKPDLF